MVVETLQQKNVDFFGDERNIFYLRNFLCRILHQYEKKHLNILELETFLGFLVCQVSLSYRPPSERKEQVLICQKFWTFFNWFCEQFLSLHNLIDL